MSEIITVEIEQQQGSKRILIPLDVPQVFFDNGAIELYASKLCGWTNESSVTALEAAAQRIRGWVKEEYKALIAEQTSEQARLAAIAQYDAAFGD